MIWSCQSKTHGTEQNIQQKLDSITSNLFNSDTITLLFVGDVMQHKPQINAALQNNGTYNFHECFKYLSSHLKSADLSVANLETTLGDGNYSGYPMFCAPKELASGLKEAGFNLIITANNHSLDRYGTGVKKTIEALDSLNIPHLGTYSNKEEKQRSHPYYIELGKYKLAFMNYTYGTNGIPQSPPTIVNLIDTTAIKQDLIQAQKDGAKIKIVCIHWGDEYHTSPNKMQKDLGRWLINNGATHVIGSHPHVIQPISIEKDTITKESHIIAYSLGNFISNMSKPNTDGGLILKLKIYDDQSFLTTQTSYSLTWVGKPKQTNLKNYYLYPSSYPEDSLNLTSLNAFKKFKKTADNIMRNNHKEVFEYFIE